MNLPQEPQYVIYLAGGCFWGLEHLFHAIPGVLTATSGYANGTGAADANYTTVCTGVTGFRETVRVTYDPAQISLDALLLAYFRVIDPTVQNRQGNDVGTQYQTGIYYTNALTRSVVERIADLEKQRHAVFCVEIGPLHNFYPAEEYHQNYLSKNPGGYCHIPWDEMGIYTEMQIDPGRYPRPSDQEIRSKLTDIQYQITQFGDTEYPFTGEYYQLFSPGIYVDIVTGEPLFSSADKFSCSCGWPAFSRPIEPPVVVELLDHSNGMRRIEVRSRAGNSHLGHVFYGEPGTPTGVRYCINSSSLRFIPLSEMETEGYGDLMNSVT